ncbi:MAG: tRNA (adenosine(37)-N6)-threonylcarbamoyltransferase complex ATPase subunit type 1 TsaE [Pseudomonadota bacterium]
MRLELPDQATLENWAAETLAPALLARIGQSHLLLLQGDLGAGKTTLARALIRSLCNAPTLDVPSPTYTLLQTYDSALGPIWHFDLYRLHHPDEVIELGWEDVNTTFLTLVEWPERLGDLQPHNAITLTLNMVGTSDTARSITVTGLDL